MKISKYTFLPVAVSIILFLIPFFWFKPGEMDLGGDSSRLYFYDPASYLSNAAVYTVSPSNFGAENLGYANLPFIFLLLILKSIGISPTILISIFYGVNLSGAFVFTYLSIKELIDTKNSWLVSAVGGLLYTFSPAALQGWKHVLITYNHIFLSPLIFYLLLRYFKTSNIRYLLSIVLITFIFSPNFSVSAAPSVFSFYPVSILFLILYTKLILKRKIIIKHIVLALMLFVGIQLFHLFLMINSMFSSGSGIHNTVFTDEGKLDRGLSYFSAIASNIKVSINLFVLPQITSLSNFSKVFIVFPLVITFAFLFNKKKTILLTAVFFLIVLFFTTANITNTWLFIYKWFFNIPGFSMFRNFNGQWLYVYIFFYSILFGQALYIVLNKLNKIHGYLLVFLLTTLLVINAMPLIKGDVANEVLWQSNNVKAVIEMDPDFEKVLSYVKTLPGDTRVLTLPLTDVGYQIIAGKNGGAYMGSSAIAFLAGKRDFGSYDEFQGYKDLIVELIKNNELEKVKRILGILNTKYVFYNADPVIYNEFPSFPYQHVRSFLPQDQDSYREFIQKLKLKEIKNIKNRFYVYEIPNDYFLPHIASTEKSVIFNGPITEMLTPLSLYQTSQRFSVFNYEKDTPFESKIKFDDVLVDIRDKSSLSSSIKSTEPPKYGFPYVSWKVSSWIYPLVTWRERRELASFKKLNLIHIDRRIFLAEKRIAELQMWSEETKMFGSIQSIDSFRNSWKEPTLWEAIVLGKYNFWEVSLVRYSRAMNDVIDRIEKASLSDSSFESNKGRVRRAIQSDKDVLYRIIQFNNKLSFEQKKYIFKLSIDMFDSLIDRIQFKTPNIEKITYRLSELDKGTYDALIDKNFLLSYDQSSPDVVINNNTFSFDVLRQKDNWVKMQGLNIKAKDKIFFTLLLPRPINLISETNWDPVEKGDLTKNSVNWTINDFVNQKNGLLREISHWNEKSYYVLSFDYVTYGNGFKLFFFEKKEEKNQEESYLIEDELRSSKWRTYKVLIPSGKDKASAFLQVLRPAGNELLNSIYSDGQGTKIEIKNLSVIEIPNPKIILKKVNTNNQKKKPQIVFTRINPSKYELKMSNVSSPYTLVLANDFNSRWKLVDPSIETSGIRAFFSRSVASIGKVLVGIFVKEDESNNSKVISYFDGDVQENVRSDVFFDKNTFDTWGKNEIAEYAHFPVNGYSNAWYIEPKDLKGKTEYALIIEMSSQKLFYFGLAISIATFFAVIALFIKGFIASK